MYVYIASWGSEASDILHAASKSILTEAHTDYVTARAVSLHRLDFSLDYISTNIASCRPQTTHLLRPRTYWDHTSTETTHLLRPHTYWDHTPTQTTHFFRPRIFSDHTFSQTTHFLRPHLYTTHLYTDHPLHRLHIYTNVHLLRPLRRSNFYSDHNCIQTTPLQRPQFYTGHTPSQAISICKPHL